MKERETFPGKAYAVTTQSGCNVYADEAGTQLIKAVEAGQGYFVAIGSRTWVDDDAAIVTETFNGAATAALGGGSAFTVDLTFSAASENAQSGVAVQKAFAANNLNATGNNTVLGLQASSNNKTYCTCVGHKAASTAWFGTAVGYHASASETSTAIGVMATAEKTSGFTLGYAGKNKDIGAGLLSVWNTRDTTSVSHIGTFLYLIGANTPLANKYEDGAACLGYVVKDGTGNILECGTRKLSELLTNNTAFAPAMLDLEAPTPTPFLPTGITDPIEFPEEITEEQLNH